MAHTSQAQFFFKAQMEGSIRILDGVTKRWSDPGEQPRELALTLDEANKILDATSLGFENGYSRLEDGCIHVGVLTQMPGCTGRQFEWWFSNYCDDTPTYQLWHPGDHVEGGWSEQYYSVKKGMRAPGHHVGKSHVVKEKVGGRLTHLHIDFKPPSTLLDMSKFSEAGVTCCLTARVHIYDALAGDTAVGHLIHMVTETPQRGCELRSRFWMGDIQHQGGGWLPARLVNYVGNTRLGRYLRAPASLGRDIHRHCFEEMSVLAAILPSIYDEARSAPNGEMKEAEAGW